MEKGGRDDSDLSGGGGAVGVESGTPAWDSSAYLKKVFDPLFYNKIGRHRPRPFDQPQDFGESRATIDVVSKEGEGMLHDSLSSVFVKNLMGFTSMFAMRLALCIACYRESGVS